MELMRLAVGKEWPGTIPMAEGAYFEMENSGPLLLMFFDRPTESEIADARRGKLQMGYYVHGSVIFLVYKLGSMPWMDAPFSVRRYKNLIQDWSDGIKPNEGISIQILLVDRVTGILHCIRFISSSNAFAKGFRREIMKQIEAPYSDTAYNTDINEIYNTMTSEDIARRAENMFRLPAKEA